MKQPRGNQQGILPAAVAVLLLVLISISSILLLRLQTSGSAADSPLLGYTLIVLVMLATIALIVSIVRRDRRHSKQLNLYRVMDESGVFSAVLDDGLTLLYCNDKFYQLLGYTKESLQARLGNRLYGCVHRDDLAVMQADLNQAVRVGGAHVHWDLRITTGAGQRRYLLTSGQVSPSQGRYLLDGMVVDITSQKEVEQELQVQQQVTQLALQDSPTSIWIYDYATKAILPAGVPGRLSNIPQMIQNVPDSMVEGGVVLPESVPAFLEMHERLFNGEERVDGIFRMKAGDRSHWFHIYYINLFDESGKPYRGVGRSEDVSVQQESLLAYQREMSFRRLMETKAQNALLFNVSRNERESFQECTAEGDDCFSDCRNLSDFYRLAASRVADNKDVRHYFTIAAEESLAERLKKPQRELTFDYIQRDDDGKLGWIRYDEHLLHDPETGDLMAFLYITDIDEQKRKEQALESAAKMDQMTGVLNHAATFSEITRFLQMEGQAETHVLYVLDVDDFKTLNDSLGHQYGDSLLADVARGICRAFRDSDIVGRVGGDEFMVLMKNCPSVPLAQRKAGELVESLQFTCRAGNIDLPLSVSVGLTMSRKGDKSFEVLYSEADAALYEAKNSGKNRWRFYGRTENDAADASERAAEGAGPVALHLVLDTMDDGVLLCEGDGGGELRFSCVSAGFLRNRETGENASEAGILLFEDALPQEREALREALHRALESGILLDHLYRAGSDNQICWRWLRTMPLPNTEDGTRRLTCTVTDVSALMDPGKLAFLAHNGSGASGVRDVKDQVTGLLEKHAFFRQVRELLDTKQDTPYLIIRCDLDRFKVFNDIFGTLSGDKLLRAFGNKLLSLLGFDVVGGRMEADHFVFFVPAAQVEPEKLSRQLGEWLETWSDSFRLSSSIGIYPIDEPEMDVSLMCDRALLALRSVKGAYVTRWGLFSETLRKQLLSEQALLDGMTEGLEKEQFQVWYQPQVNYADGSLVGAEALVRWDHPERGLLLPGEFLPLFEQNGFISRLDEYVWEHACRDLRRWLDSAAPDQTPLSVSVNVSRLDIYNPKLPHTLQRLVDKYRLSPSLLHLEITESSYVQTPDQLVEAVKALQALGFTVEMDDFGAGYSSLNVLKDVPVDVIKLDVRFLEGGGDSARGDSIIDSVIRMARWLRLPVIAEGVETKQRADYLKSLGCLYMQGYYFDQPMPAADFAALLASSAVGVLERYQTGGVEGLEDFWNATQTAILFSDFADGAAILEYRDGNVDVLRTNERYYKTLRTTRKDYAQTQTHLLDRFDQKNRAVFIDMLERAIQSGQETECEVESLPYPGRDSALWTHTRVLLLAHSDGSYIFYSAVADVTERRQLQSLFRNLENDTESKDLRRQRLLQLTVASSFEYICLIQPDTGQYEFFTCSGDSTDLSPQAGNFTEATLAISEQVVLPEDRARFIQCSSIDNLVRELNAGAGHYKFFYRLLNGVREADFSWYEDSHKGILMTVRVIHSR